QMILSIIKNNYANKRFNNEECDVIIQNICNQSKINNNKVNSALVYAKSYLYQDDDGLFFNPEKRKRTRKIIKIHKPILLKDIPIMELSLDSDVEQEKKQETKNNSKHELNKDLKLEQKNNSKQELKKDLKLETKQELKKDLKIDLKPEQKNDSKQELKKDLKIEQKNDSKQELKKDLKQELKKDLKQELKKDLKKEQKNDSKQELKKDI